MVKKKKKIPGQRKDDYKVIVIWVSLIFIQVDLARVQCQKKIMVLTMNSLPYSIIMYYKKLKNPKFMSGSKTIK